ncbi:MAG: wax ester/triacylglycerol synthase family O-acyltransferase [Actinomycetes bacterium]
MDRLSALDVGFLQVETDRQQMHVGSLLFFEGPAPTFAAITRHLESCLPFVPRYRQRVQHAPLDLARPMWVDDPHFSLSYHLRHTAIPAPGDRSGLQALVGRVMSQRLDVDRPLWEMWVVEGLSDGRWAMITKIHHAMIDGVAGSELLEIMFASEPGIVFPDPPPWQPEPTPSDLQLAASGLKDIAHLPLDAAQAAVSAARSPRHAAEALAGRVFGLATAGRSVAVPASLLNGPVGPHRLWGWADADLAEVKAVKKAHGCTVNDVVLAACAGGFRAYLLARGEQLEGTTIRSLVPVSMRTEDQRGQMGNHVTAVFADLPVGIADPLARLDAIHAQMDHLKHNGQAIGVEAMLSAGDFVPATLMSLGARVYAHTGQWVVNTVTTNVPGPQQPLYLLDRQMLQMYPYIPVALGVRISVGIMSYDGQLAVGVTGDYDAVPDLDVLCAAIEASFAELVASLHD